MATLSVRTSVWTEFRSGLIRAISTITDLFTTKEDESVHPQHRRMPFFAEFGE